MDPSEAAKLSVPSRFQKGAAKGTVPISKSEDARYLGCFSSESFFGGREYVGGANGANYNLMHHYAAQVMESARSWRMRRVRSWGYRG